MSRRHKGGDHGEAHADERWLVTYADMITLLLAVFIVMYALSDTNVRKFTAFAQSLSSAFNTDVFAGSEAFTVTSGQESAPDTGAFDSGAGMVSSDARTIQAVVKDYAIQQGLGGDVAVDQVPEGISIRIRAEHLFEPGRARLDGGAVSLLDRIVDTIRPLAQRVRIIGHTDDTPTSGALYADNFELSAARAMSVMRYLVAAGVSPVRLSVEGAGQYDPLVPNTSEENRARNRRVDILLLYPRPASATDGPSAGTESAAPFDPGVIP